MRRRVADEFRQQYAEGIVYEARKLEHQAAWDKKENIGDDLKKAQFLANEEKVATKEIRQRERHEKLIKLYDSDRAQYRDELRARGLDICMSK